MNDSDDNEKKGAINAEKRKKLNSSFKNIGDNIIKEGSTATKPSTTKRMGSISKKSESSNKNVQNYKSQSINNDIFSEEEKKKYIYKQGIETRQAIDEISDKIDVLELDINKYVNQMRQEQNKIDLGDVKDSMKVLEKTLKKDLSDTKNKNIKDLEKVKDVFNGFKDKIIQLITKVTEDNDNKISNLVGEIDEYEKKVHEKFSIIHQRQDKYIKLLEIILDTTKDKNTQTVIQNFLVDDHEMFEINKQRYEDEYNNKKEIKRKKQEEKEKRQLKELLDEEIRKLEEKTKKKTKENYKFQSNHYEFLNEYNEQQKMIEMREIENLKKLEEIEKRLKNQNYYNFQKYNLFSGLKNNEKDNQKEENNEKPYEKPEISNNNQDIQINKENIIGETPIEIKRRQSLINIPINFPNTEKKITNEKLNVSNNRLSQIFNNIETQNLNKNEKLTSNENIKEKESVSKFLDVYSKGENKLREFLKNKMRNAFVYLLKIQPININKDKFIGNNQNDGIIKEKINVINLALKMFLDELNSSIKRKKISEDIKNLFKFVFDPNNYITFKFFSCFELSRLEIKDGYITEINSEEKKMIIAFHIILKIIIKHFLLNLKFFEEEDISKIDDIHKINFKVIGSIIYYEVIELFKNKCEIKNNITNFKTFLESQGRNDPELINILNKGNFITGFPDLSVNHLQYLYNDLFKPNDLSVFYQHMKNKESDIQIKIDKFVNEFLSIIEK